MYVYFNNQGDLTTNIPHGETVRQGSSLNLYVCLPIDFFSGQNTNYENWTAKVSTVFSDNSIGALNVFTNTTVDNVLKVFRKTKDSEVTYDLVDGMPYFTYFFKLSPEQSTIKAGKIKIQVTLVDTMSDNNIINLGSISVYVERLLGMHGEATGYQTELSDKLNDLLTSSDVLEFASISAFPEDGKTGKLYIAKDTNLLYRRGTDGYIQVGVYEKLKFTNVTANSWVADLTYATQGYNFKCELECPGITSSSIVQVIYGMAEAVSGDYAPVCLTGIDTVTIYSKSNSTIIIPVIKEI